MTLTARIVSAPQSVTLPVVTPVVATAAGLRSLVGSVSIPSALLSGFQGGTFAWNSASAVDNGVTRYNAVGLGNSGPGWDRIFSGPIDVRWAGAVGDSTTGLNGTDDTAAIQRAIDAAVATGRGVVEFPAGFNFRATATLTCPAAITLRGDGGVAGGVGGNANNFATLCHNFAGDLIVFDGSAGGAAASGGGVENLRLVQCFTSANLNGTYTADAGTNTFTDVAHGLNNGDAIRIATTGTFPGGLSNFDGYFVVNKTLDTFQLADTIGGAAIDITDNGTGVQTWTKNIARGAAIKVAGVAWTKLRGLIIEENGTDPWTYAVELDVVVDWWISQCTAHVSAGGTAALRLNGATGSCIDCSWYQKGAHVLVGDTDQSNSCQLTRVDISGTLALDFAADFTYIGGICGSITTTANTLGKCTFYPGRLVNAYTSVAQAAVGVWGYHEALGGTFRSNKPIGLYNGQYLGGLNAAGSTLHSLIGLDANATTRLGLTTLVAIGSPASAAGAAVGDLVIANQSYFRGVNVAGALTKRLIGMDGEDNIALGADGNNTRLYAADLRIDQTVTGPGTWGPMPRSSNTNPADWNLTGQTAFTGSDDSGGFINIQGGAKDGAGTHGGVRIRSGDGNNRLVVDLTGAAITGDVSASGAAKIGVNPADAGIIRIPNDEQLTARNAADDDDCPLVGMDANDRVTLGGDAAEGILVREGGRSLIIKTGTATPEGAYAAPVGSLFIDTTNGRLYVKNTGTGNTGWQIVTQT